MADITVKGWANKPQSKTSGDKKFSTFTLKEGQKQKDGTYVNVFYNVTNFNADTAPEDGSKVQVQGWLKMRQYDSSTGDKRTSYDIIAQQLEVLSAPVVKEAGAPAEKDPFDL